MNLAPVQIVAAPAEAPRPAQQPTLESTHPVLAPPRAEAAAQQVRNEDERPSGRDARAQADARGHEPTTGSVAGKDLLVGAILDVFA